MPKRLGRFLMCALIILTTITASAAQRDESSSQGAQLFARIVRRVVRIVKHFTTTTDEETMSIPKP